MKKSLLLGFALISSAMFAEGGLQTVLPQGDYVNVLSEISGQVNTYKACPGLRAKYAVPIQDHLQDFAGFATEYATFAESAQTLRNEFATMGVQTILKNTQRLLSLEQNLPQLPAFKGNVSDSRNSFTGTWCPGMNSKLRGQGHAFYAHYENFVHGYTVLIQGLNMYVSKVMDAAIKAKKGDVSTVDLKKIIAETPDFPMLPALK